MVQSQIQKNQDEIIRRLLTLAEEVRFEEVNQLLDTDVLSGLQIANSVLRDKKYLVSIFEKGLNRADASSIQYWLKYLIPRLGFRRVVGILSEKLQDRPQEVAKATYWLSRFLPPNSEKDLTILRDFLKKEKEMIGDKYKVASTSGQVYKLILKVKSTGEFAVFGGYQLGSHGSGVIVEILDQETLYPTGGTRIVAPSEIAIVDPQPYKD
jgi:hypothetical protein